MVTSREGRRLARSARAVEAFGKQSDAALDAFTLLDFAWHDCYGDSPPPEQVVEDVWEVGSGDIGQLVSAVHLAVIDFRDLRVWADRHRTEA